MSVAKCLGVDNLNASNMREPRQSGRAGKKPSPRLTWSTTSTICRAG